MARQEGLDHGGKVKEFAKFMGVFTAVLAVLPWFIKYVSEYLKWVLQ